jgi:hypothetical protein
MRVGMLSLAWSFAIHPAGDGFGVRIWGPIGAPTWHAMCCFGTTVSQILFSGMLHVAKLDDSIKRAAVLMTSLNPGRPKSTTPIANRAGASKYHIFM